MATIILSISYPDPKVSLGLGLRISDLDSVGLGAQLNPPARLLLLGDLLAALFGPPFALSCPASLLEEAHRGVHLELAECCMSVVIAQ